MAKKSTLRARKFTRMSELAHAMGYRYDEDEIKEFKETKRKFYKKLRQLSETMSCGADGKTPSNRIMLLRRNVQTKKLEVKPFLEMDNARVLEKIPSLMELVDKFGSQMPAEVNTPEKKMYWALENDKLQVREDHTLLSSGEPMNLYHCLFVKDDSKEAYYADQPTADKMQKVMGRFINLQYRNRTKDANLCLKINTQSLTNDMEELDRVFHLYDGDNREKKKKKEKKKDKKQREKAPRKKITTSKTKTARKPPSSSSSKKRSLPLQPPPSPQVEKEEPIKKKSKIVKLTDGFSDTATTTITDIAMDQDVTTPTVITKESPEPLNKLVVGPMLIEKESPLPPLVNPIIMTPRPKVLALNTFFTTSVLSPVHTNVHK